MAGISGLLEEIEAAYSGILNHPFTGYYDGKQLIEDTGSTRMLICYKEDVQFSALVGGVIQEVEKIEMKYGQKIWKGVIGHWKYNLYIAQGSPILTEDAQAANTFVVDKIEAVQNHPELVIRFPFVCNLYVKALPCN